MKKLLIAFLALLIFTAFPLHSYAAGISGNVFNINGITIEFSADSSFSAEEQAAIAGYVVNGREDDSATTYNILCTLFGHKTTTETFTVIEHRVSDTAPRCMSSLQDVTACSRCDYVYIEVLTSNYIFCCD